MVLQTQPESSHNQMLGQRVKHPPSTNYEDAENGTPSKRLKRLDTLSDGKSASESDGIQGEESDASEIRFTYRMIPDEDEESDENPEQQPSSSHQTDLESALPQIKTDQDAIEEYEASRAVESGPLEDVRTRFGNQGWVKGRSSIYVDAFNLALETVLEDERHLFDEAELSLFQDWRQLDYEAQYLYVRLFLRKTSSWHRINNLGYYSDIADMQHAIEILQTERELPLSSSEVVATPAELEPPTGTTLSSTYSFAEASEDHIKTLDEASSLLKLDELKTIAKEAKVQGKNKKELLKAFRQSSYQQKGLEFRGLRRSDTEVSTGEVDDDHESAAAPESSRDQHFLQKILSCTGPCIRLSLAPLRLFERVHLVFYRSTEWTEKSLTTLILAKIARRNFPDYLVSRSANIFASRAELLEFEASLRTQFRVDNILEFNGTPTRSGLQSIVDVLDEVYPRWKMLTEVEQKKEGSIYTSGEGAYLRRFSPAWVYTRIIHKSTYVLGKLKQHKREHQLLTELLDQKLFHASRRGAWYQRKALLEEHYMAALEADEGRNSEAQKKHWKRISLKTCEEGLQDRDCHLIYHYDLQKRITKLEKNLKVVKREQHDFSHVRLVKAVERTVEGIRVEHTPESGSRGVETSRLGTKTIWKDEREGGGDCSVEQMCLSWYRDQGWKGYHSEGGILRTLFAYLFYDVIFAYIPNVFQTAYQTCPLDLHTDAFFPSRASEINSRLVDISNGEASLIIQEINMKEREKKTCVAGLDWSFELDDLLEIVDCFEGGALATICKVMAQEYPQRGGGVPDLFLWNPKQKEVMFSEVKSENDRLSDTQRLWIHVLTGAGVAVELCNAVAKRVER